MNVGLIKWFDTEKGFGVVKSVTTNEAFIHKNEFILMPPKIGPATALIYNTKTGRNGKIEAVGAHLPESFEDWKLIMDLLGKDDKVSIEIDVLYKKRYGGTFRKKETKLFSIKSYAAHWLLRTKIKEDVVSIITRYFKSFIVNKNPHFFYEYAILIKQRIEDLSFQDKKGVLKEIFSFFNENKNAIVLFQAWANNDPGVLGFESESDKDSYDVYSWSAVREPIFPVEELTVSFFHEVANLIRSEHILKIKALSISDHALTEVFNLRLKEALKSDDFIEYDFLCKLIDGISNEEVRKICNQKLLSSQKLISKINQDKTLLEVCIRFPEKSTIEMILKLWHHDNPSLTVTLLKKLKDLQFPLEGIDEEFYIKLANTASLNDLNSILNIYNSRFLVLAIIDKIDFGSHNPTQYLGHIRNIDENLPLLTKKIENLITDIESNFSYFRLQKPVEIIRKLGKDKFPVELLNKIEQESIKYLPKTLAESLGNGKITSIYDFTDTLNVYRQCQECLFSDVYTNDHKAVFESFILQNSTPKVVSRAWEQGYIPSFESYLMSELNQFSSTELEELFESGKLKKDLINTILEIKIQDGSPVDWILQMAEQHVDLTRFRKFDKKISQLLSTEQYFDLWKKGIGKIFPQEAIFTFISYKSEEIYQIQNWIKSGLCNINQIGPVLLNALKSITEIKDRRGFYIKLRCIKCLVELDLNYVSIILEMNHPFDKLILWFLELSADFSFGVLQRKFIYFSPDDQVKIIKRLFYLKHHGKIDFTIEELDNIVRADLDIFLSNERFNDDFVLDVSTSLVIELIKNFKSQGRFLADSELLKIVLHDIGKDKKRKFNIEKYFEKCLGRMSAKWNWETAGKIFKRQIGYDIYFTVEFEYDSDLVEKIKMIPGRRYDTNNKIWIIPLTSEEQVIKFGRDNDFFFSYGNNNYSNNTHLAILERKDVPSGIKFCEGRLANKRDSKLDKQFWWCTNLPCLKNCETEHLKMEDNYNDLTLLDFLKISEINVDENSNYGFFPNGRYYQMMSQVNRFNRLLEKLYCHSCEEIMFPVESSNFAAYTVVRFSCQNNSCSEHGKEVYLNHCLDGKCNCIIDSRVSKKCQNGLYVCANCGGCCSHEMLSRRLNNLKTTGGVIHQKLVECVEMKLGHKEKNMYFCYKCSSLMTEVIDDINGGPAFFKCMNLNCDVEYHPSSTTQRPHSHLRPSDYPKIRLSDIRGNRNTQNPSSEFPDFDF